MIGSHRWTTVAEECELEMDASRLAESCRVLLARFDRAGVKPYSEQSVLEARTTVEAGRRLQSAPREVPTVYDVLAPTSDGGIPIRIYVADESGSGPTIVYFHGGGWVTGSIESSDVLCRRLAIESGGTVASVAYRLSPETQYPGPLEDCYAATCWLASGGGGQSTRTPLVVCGDSAGGNLATATALLGRDRDNPSIASQVLVYPALTPEAAGFGQQRVGPSYGLSRQDMDWFWRHYLGDRSADGLAAPLLAEKLTGMPPALIIVAEFDPLREEGLTYAGVLRAAGVRVDVIEVPGVIHGFLSMDKAVPEAGPVIERVGRWIARSPALPAGVGA